MREAPVPSGFGLLLLLYRRGAVAHVCLGVAPMFAGPVGTPLLVLVACAVHGGRRGGRRDVRAGHS